MVRVLREGGMRVPQSLFKIRDVPVTQGGTLVLVKKRNPVTVQYLKIRRTDTRTTE